MNKIDNGMHPTFNEFLHGRSGRRGIFYALILGILTIFLIAMMYVVFDNSMQNEVQTLMTEQHVDTGIQGQILAGWQFYPIVAIFCIFLVMIIIALSRGNTTGWV
jgi:Flp pilus assembly pilin Flp